MTELDEITAQVRALIIERLRLDPATPLDTRTSLEALGVDSAALLSLVIGVEERFEFDISDDEITREHFASVASVASFVAERLGTP